MVFFYQMSAQISDLIADCQAARTKLAILVSNIKAEDNCDKWDHRAKWIKFGKLYQSNTFRFLDRDMNSIRLHRNLHLFVFLVINVMRFRHNRNKATICFLKKRLDRVYGNWKWKHFNQLSIALRRNNVKTIKWSVYMSIYILYICTK